MRRRCDEPGSFVVFVVVFVVAWGVFQVAATGR